MGYYSNHDMETVQQFHEDNAAAFERMDFTSQFPLPDRDWETI